MAAVYQKNDAAYVAWRAASPLGWVANVNQSLGGRYFKVHRAACLKAEDYSRAKNENPFTGGNYAKVVAGDLIDLCAWRIARGGSLPADMRCLHCCAEVAIPDLFEPSADPVRLAAATAALLNAPAMSRPRGIAHPILSTSSAATRVTSPAVRAWVMRRARGVCELCDADAPFVTPDGEPFLELHHIHHLAHGGPDSVENCAGLCPNCHRRIHLSGAGAALSGLLLTRVVERERSLPQTLPSSQASAGAASTAIM